MPIKVIAERLGHEDPAFTMKQYAHVIPGMQADAARLIASTVHAATPSDTGKPHPPTRHRTGNQHVRPTSGLTQV